MVEYTDANGRTAQAEILDSETFNGTEVHKLRLDDGQEGWVDAEQVAN